jgi:hypothetical protein
MLAGSKPPRYAAVKIKRMPVQSELVSTVTHWAEPVVLVNMYES